MTLTNLGFECVVRGLRAGRKMKREWWLNDNYIFYDHEKKVIIFHTANIYGFFDTLYAANSDDIMAQDWCIV